MIKVTNVKNADPVNNACLVIMRSNRFVPDGAIWVPDLAPTWDLFNKFQELKKTGQWSKETFDNVYVPQFMRDIQSKKSRDWLNKLYYWDITQEKGVQICCTCLLESMCHRVLVGGILEGVGCRVMYDVGDSYIKYYQMFKELFDADELKIRQSL